MNHTQIKKNHVKKYGLLIVITMLTLLVVAVPSINGQAYTTTTVGIQPLAQEISDGGGNIDVIAYTTKGEIYYDPGTGGYYELLKNGTVIFLGYDSISIRLAE